MNAPIAGAVPTAPSGPPKRKLRNFLLDPRFQLKYSAIIVAVAMTLMLVLGVVIWRVANVAARQAQTAVQQSYLAATQAERAMEESRTSSRIVGMQRMSDNPELMETIQRQLDAADREAEQNLAHVRRQRAAVDLQRSDIERNRLRTLYALVGTGLLLVILLGLAGIVITHKIVGPVFKLKRLLRQVGTGKFHIKERLRKGDELEDLFNVFLGMAESLKKFQEREIAEIDAVIKDLEAQSAPPAALAKLRTLRAEMTGSLGSPESMRPPAA